MPLKPDNIETINGLKVYDYNLLEHNPNKIDMPSRARTRTVAITVHNTGWIKVANTTPAEQYVRATYNGNMGSCRVNYYVDNVCAWRCMPDDWVNWSCADGCANPSSGNNTSLAIEVIGDSKEAEENAIKLIAHLLNKYKLSINTGLRTHSYWLNIKAGKKGTIDALNVMKNSVKNCPVYILPHWSEFKDNVKKELDKLNNTEEKAVEKPKYIVKDGETIKEFTSLEIAKQNCSIGCSVSYNGKVVYTNEPPRAEKSQVDVFYKSFVNGRWLNEIKNCNDNTTLGYSGIINRYINGISAKASVGKLAYRVHVLNGGWLNWITKYDTNDWSKGVAGLRSQAIDGIQFQLMELEGYKVEYRVSTYGMKKYLPWVEDTKDYAGIFGKPIDQIQVRIVGAD